MVAIPELDEMMANEVWKKTSEQLPSIGCADSCQECFQGSRVDVMTARDVDKWNLKWKVGGS